MFMTDKHTTGGSRGARVLAAIALLVLAVGLCEWLNLAGVSFRGGSHADRTALASILVWNAVASLLGFVFSRGVLRWLMAVGLVVLTPLALGSVYWAFDILLGLGEPTDASVATIALALTGFVSVYALRGLPLISKELREQSARRRTYILRLVYAALAYVTAFSFSADQLMHDGYTLQEVMGQGGILLETYASLQFFGIYLFMPAMCCSLITSEKERDTLTLLFLTRMTPGRLLAGKFLSRLLPMFFFILLSLPLFGFAYSLGGFELETVATTLWLLCVTTVQVGAVALMFSCWFRTTVGAFIASYVSLLILTAGPVVLYETTMIVEEIYEFLTDWLGTDTVFGLVDSDLMGAFAPSWTSHDQGFLECVVHTTPALIVTGFCLGLARLFIVRRATAKPRNRILQVFRGFDRLFRFFNEKLCGGIVVLAGEGHLARDRPIAWRETTHRTMGTSRYLIRIFMLIEYPILFLCSICVGTGTGLGLLELVLPLVWAVVVLLICGASASVISAERGGQTLDVLLSTPMTGRSILSQKLTGLRRLICVLSIPLLTIYIFQAMLRFDVPDLAPERSGFEPDLLTWTYLVSGVACVLIFLPLVSWLAFWIGLKVRSQGKAIIVSVTVLVSWCLLPIIAYMPYEALSGDDSKLLELVEFASPMMNIHMHQHSGFKDPLQVLIRTLYVYGGLLVALRCWCLWRAPRVLGRADTSRRVRRSQRHEPTPTELPAT